MEEKKTIKATALRDALAALGLDTEHLEKLLCNAGARDDLKAINYMADGAQDIAVGGTLQFSDQEKQYGISKLDWAVFEAAHHVFTKLPGCVGICKEGLLEHLDRGELLEALGTLGLFRSIGEEKPQVIHGDVMRFARKAYRPRRQVLFGHPRDLEQAIYHLDAIVTLLPRLVETQAKTLLSGISWGVLSATTSAWLYEFRRQQGITERAEEKHAPEEIEKTGHLKQTGMLFRSAEDMDDIYEGIR